MRPGEVGDVYADPATVEFLGYLDGAAAAAEGVENKAQFCVSHPCGQSGQIRLNSRAAACWSALDQAARPAVAMARLPASRVIGRITGRASHEWTVQEL